MQYYAIGWLCLSRGAGPYDSTGGPFEPYICVILWFCFIKAKGAADTTIHVMQWEESQQVACTDACL